MSMHILSTSDNIKATVTQHFELLPNQCDKEFFAKSQLRIKQLQNVLDLLCCLPTIENNLALCLHKHDDLPSGATIATVLHNLHTLRQHLLEMKLNTENTLFHILDTCFTNTAENLQSIMKLVRLFGYLWVNFDTIPGCKELESEVTIHLL